MATSAWTAVYTNIRNRLLAARPGIGGTGPNGSLPVTRPLDCWAMLAELHDSVVNCIKKHGDHIEEVQPGGHWLSVQLGVRPDGADARVVIYGGATPIHSAEFLLASPTATDALVRVDTAGHYWTVVTDVGYGAVDELESIRYVVEKWDRCIQLAATAFALVLIEPKMNAAHTVEWWKAFYALCLAIEIVIAIPTPGLGDRLWDGIQHATTETIHTLAPVVKELAHAAGQAAGELATVAGEAAGKAGAGFFQSAGLGGYVFVGAAIWLVTKGWL